MGSEGLAIAKLHGHAGRRDVEVVEVLFKGPQGGLTEALAQQALTNVDTDAGQASASVEDDGFVRGVGAASCRCIRPAS